MYSHLPFKKRKIIPVEPASSSSSSSPMEVDENTNDTDEDDTNQPEFENDVIILNDMRSKRRRIDAITVNNYFLELEHAFKGNLKTYYLKNNDSSVKDICMLLSLHKNPITKYTITELTYLRG